MSMKGRSKLASKLQARMSNVANFNKGVNLELGTICAGYSLELDSLPGIKLKKNEYFVCQGVKYIANYLKSNVADANKIETKILKTGDRVLVAWTYDGEVVVIDKIITASSL